MATYYVELSGGGLRPTVQFRGGDIYAGGGGGGGASLVSTSVSYMPTAAGISDTLIPPIGYDGFDQVGVTVTGDADLVAGNIKNGVTIFGVTGSYIGGGASLVSTSVSYTPSETAISDTLTPPTGYDGFDQVGVSVGAISSTYVGSGITQRTSSDLSASGATVTAPSGYYASNATKTIASAPTPTLNMNSVSASGALNVNVDFASGGYVSAGTINLTEAGAFSVQAAQTLHPSTSDQTISADKYLTGAQTIKGVLLTNLTAGNIKKDVVVKVGDSTDDDCVTSVTGTYEGGGGGAVNVYYNTVSNVGSTWYVENLIIPSETSGGFTQRLRGAANLKSVKSLRTSYGGSTDKLSGAFQGCSLLETVEFLDGLSASGYSEDIIKDCPNIKSFTTGGIGYPNTVGMGSTNSTYYLFRNVTEAFDIIIYTTATALANVPSNLRTGSPWGATNATIIYKNSVTGDVLV